MYTKRTGQQVATISDNVYYALRKNIIELNLKPGVSISIKEISEELGVSRSPVRDAIIKLEREGLISTIPQIGTKVSKIDLKRVTEERFLREALEEKTLLIFMELYNQNHIEMLNEKLEKQRKYLNNAQYNEFIEYDDQFHEIFFEAANKRMCWNLIQSMSSHYRRIRFITLWDDSVIATIINQHERLMDCLKRKDASATIEAIKLHCSKLENEEKVLLKRYPEYFVQPEAADSLEYSFLRKDFLSL